MPLPLIRTSSHTGASLNRRRGTATSGSSNEHSRMLMYIVAGMAILGSTILGIFIGVFFFGNAAAPSQQQEAKLFNTPLKKNSGVGFGRIEDEDEAGPFLRGGGNLRDRWNEKADKFKEYLHHKHEKGVEASQHRNKLLQEQGYMRGGASASAIKPGEFPYMGWAPPHNYNIAASWVPPGGYRYQEYTDGHSPYPITDELRHESDDLARIRRTYVKKAMEYGWGGYSQYAWGMDEILPSSRRGTNNWGGFAVTLVDSLDTLWLLGMKDEFYKARDYVRDTLRHDKSRAVSVFETTIRSVGGLLSAYDWSKDKVFLDSAMDLARRLMKAFDNSSTGIPFGQVNLATGGSSNIPWAGNNAILAEFGTLQLEYRWLDAFINTPETAGMRKKVENIYDILYKMSPPNGLYPYYMKNQNAGSGLPTFANDHFTFGAMSDSFYEYLLKTWLQGGKVEPMYREMYDKAMQGMHDELLHKSDPSGLYYIADKTGHMLDHKMDHLVCFMGGLLALGAYTDPLGMDSTRAMRDLKTAKALTYTCYQMYARMNTGISPEFVQFYKGDDFRIGTGAPHYLLRPETIESLFILNHLTGDPIYREWGWEIFQSIEKYCRAGVAYGTLKDVSNTNLHPNDKMETFFFAETMKYLYLLFDPDTEIDLLNKHVLNTEAHPIRILSEITKNDQGL